MGNNNLNDTIFINSLLNFIKTYRRFIIPFITNREEFNSLCLKDENKEFMELLVRFDKNRASIFEIMYHSVSDRMQLMASANFGDLWDCALDIMDKKQNGKY